MDIKSSLVSGPHVVDTFQENVPFSKQHNSLASSNCGLIGVTNIKTDALEAVKLDPAVLEAKVTAGASGVFDSKNSYNLDSVVGEMEESSPPSSSRSFEDMVMQHEAALLSLTPNQLGSLMKFADILRRQRTVSRKYIECAFCKNNGRSVYWYTSHSLKDGRGRVLCPVLRAFRCPRCGATGDRAHTIKYCPEPGDAESTRSSF